MIVCLHACLFVLFFVFDLVLIGTFLLVVVVVVTLFFPSCFFCCFFLNKVFTYSPVGKQGREISLPIAQWESEEGGGGGEEGEISGSPPRFARSGRALWESAPICPKRERSRSRFARRGRDLWESAPICPKRERSRSRFARRGRDLWKSVPLHRIESSQWLKDECPAGHPARRLTLQGLCHGWLVRC